MMDLIQINREPREIPQSKRKSETFSVEGWSLASVQARVIKAQAAFKERGFDLFRVSFGAGCHDDGEAFPTCTVEASRMETPEETAARCTRDEAYNKRQREEYQQKVDTAERNKEIKRILGGLTTEQLKVISQIRVDG